MTDLYTIRNSRNLYTLSVANPVVETDKGALIRTGYGDVARVGRYLYALQSNSTTVDLINPEDPDSQSGALGSYNLSRTVTGNITAIAALNGILYVVGINLDDFVSTLYAITPGSNGSLVSSGASGRAVGAIPRGVYSVINNSMTGFRNALYATATELTGFTTVLWAIDPSNPSNVSGSFGLVDTYPDDGANRSSLGEFGGALYNIHSRFDFTLRRTVLSLERLDPSDLSNSTIIGTLTSGADGLTSVRDVTPAPTSVVGTARPINVTVSLIRATGGAGGTLPAVRTASPLNVSVDLSRATGFTAGPLDPIIPTPAPVTVNTTDPGRATIPLPSIWEFRLDARAIVNDSGGTEDVPDTEDVALGFSRPLSAPGVDLRAIIDFQVTVDDDGNNFVTVAYSDGSTDSFTVVGGAGLSVSTVNTLANGAIRVVFSDGTPITIPRGLAGQPGNPGRPGEPGENGLNGRGIRSITRDPDTGRVLIVYDDGTQATFVIRDGVSYIEVAVYRVVRLGQSAVTPAAATWNWSTRLLSNLGGAWTQDYPTFDPATHQVICTTASAGSDDTLGPWSVPRSCDSPADMNIVFVRSEEKPNRLTQGSLRVPTGTYDARENVPFGDGPVWSAVGHKNPFGMVWTWQDWRRLEGVDGKPGHGGIGWSRTYTDLISARSSQPLDPQINTPGEYLYGSNPNTWEDLKNETRIAISVLEDNDTTSPLSLATRVLREYLKDGEVGSGGVQRGDVLTLFWSNEQWIDYTIRAVNSMDGAILRASYTVRFLESRAPENPTIPVGPVDIWFNRAPLPIEYVPLMVYKVFPTRPTDYPGALSWNPDTRVLRGTPQNSWLLELPNTHPVGSSVWARETVVQSRSRTPRAIQGTSSSNTDWGIAKLLYR